MKKATQILVFFLPVVFLCMGELVVAQSSAYTTESLPNPKKSGRGYVSNPDRILSAQQVSQLNRLCAAIEDSSAAQVAVAIVNSIGLDDPKLFATELFAKWGIGQAATDNGLLIFTVMDQRRTEFETGYGMEAILPDIYCYRIGRQVLVPYFKRGQYGEGLQATLLEIQKILNDPTVIEEWKDDATFSGDQFPIFSNFLFYYALIALLFNCIIIFQIIRVLNNKEDLYDKYLALKKLQIGIFIFLFPIAYLFIYFYLIRKLQQLREAPRHSKMTGLPMRKLSEEEEDPYLEKGQITEEDIQSVDYDVWVSDEDKGNDLLILRYARRFTRYNSCPKCGYKTYYLARSVTVRYPTQITNGVREHIHECKNCNYRKVRQEIIPRLPTPTSSGGGRSRGGGSWSGGSSSWGGGSSGGGGAGVSW